MYVHNYHSPANFSYYTHVSMDTCVQGYIYSIAVGFSYSGFYKVVFLSTLFLEAMYFHVDSYLMKTYVYATYINSDLQTGIILKHRQWNQENTGGTFPHKILIIGTMPHKLFSHLINACSFCVVVLILKLHDDHYMQPVLLYFAIYVSDHLYGYHLTGYLQQQMMFPHKFLRLQPPMY